MFRFLPDDQESGGGGGGGGGHGSDTRTAEGSEVPTAWLPASEGLKVQEGDKRIKPLEIDGWKLQRIVMPASSAAGIAVSQFTDVKSGVYEGGLKLWECAIDLLSVLSKETVENTVVFEAGCGQGVPGIVALLLGAKSVTFQDYNLEVLRDLTIPNVELNTKGVSAKYIYGDWSVIASKTKEGREGWGHLANSVDLILSSDTLYNVEYFEPLARLTHAILAPGGRALFAAKRYYFGVGGGTRGFESHIASFHGLSASVLKVIDDGSSNLREVVEVVKAKD